MDGLTSFFNCLLQKRPFKKVKIGFIAVKNW